jgi:hypothetical protein
MVSSRPIFQSRMRLSTISSAGRTKSIGAQGLVGRDAGALERLLEHEGDLGLDPRLEEGAHRDRHVLEVEEVVEQVAVVGLGDPEQPLHRRARQADLVALHGAPGGQALLDLEQLDGVGVLEGHALVGRGERLERLPGLVGREQPTGHQRAGLVVHGGFLSGGCFRR